MELSQEQKDRIEAGAKLLDEKNPGWAKAVNQKTFDINSFSHCILCNVYGTFQRGLLELFPNECQSEFECEGARNHGFYPHKSESLWDWPDEEVKENVYAKNLYWLKMIQERLS
jgi:hypothetical protein